MSPTAIKLAKASFNAPSEEIRGIGAVALRGLSLYYETEEALEGKNAFLEKRKPDFRKFRTIANIPVPLPSREGARD